MEIIIKTRALIKKQILDIKTYGIRELLRKLYLLIKFLARVPVDIVAVMPCILIRLISPWLIIRIQKIPVTNFGDFLEFTVKYYCEKELKIDQLTKKSLDLMYIHYKNKVYNKQIAKMFKRKLNFLSGYLLDPINRVNRLIPGWKIHTIESFQIRHRDVNKLFVFDKFKILDFTNEEKIYGKKILNKFGLKDKDKFVTLHVRDKAYQLKKVSARYRDWSDQDYRHTDIDKFVLAAEELTKRGYYVFRMGVIVEKPFKSKNPKIIDYANSNLRSDFMDIYLGAKCSFCISTGSGFLYVPIFFKKPIIDLSVPLGHKLTYSEKYLLMIKHHVLKKEKRRLSLSEIFSYGVAYADETKFFEQKGIQLVENTPEEIKDLAIEMVEYLDSKKKLNPEDEELQRTFRGLYTSNILRYDDPRSYFLKKEVLHGQITSRFGTKFLRENRDWLR